MKILLIDDEQALLKVFTQTLETLGHFTVVTAETGNEGIEKVRTELPDLILLDQVLPDINGNQILQMIKQDPSTKNIPVAMLSNFNQDNLVQDAINLGALDYILKYQIEPEDLVAKVNKIIKAYIKPPAIENDIPLSPIAPPPQAEPIPPVSVNTEKKPDLNPLPQVPEPVKPPVPPIEVQKPEPGSQPTMPVQDVKSIN